MSNKSYSPFSGYLPEILQSCSSKNNVSCCLLSGSGQILRCILWSGLVTHLMTIFSSVVLALYSSAGAHLINNMHGIFIYLFSEGRKGLKKKKKTHLSAAHSDSRKRKYKRGNRTWNRRETNVTGSVFCFCAQRAFPHNGHPHVTEGAHQQKVKALITWIKAAGMATS